MAKQHRLQDVIYRNFLASSLIPLVGIELLLLALYFGINAYITQKHQNALLAEVTSSLQEISGSEVNNIDNQLKDVSRHAIVMQRNHEHFFRIKGPCPLPNGEPVFARHANGALYKSKDNGGASVYYSSDTAIGPDQMRKARCSEILDPVLELIVKSNPIISQAYLNTWDNMNRLYPFMQDAPGQYGPTLKMTDYNFYSEADGRHNPARKPVWTGAYLDPAGQGWMVSCIVPIYNGDFLEGVSGIDVTIEAFVQHILNRKMSWEGKSFLLDSSGMILAMPKTVETLFNLPELTRHEYVENIKGTVEKPKEYNILNMQDTEIRSQLKQIFHTRARVGNLEINGKEFLISQESVPETDWRLITLVDTDVIFSRILELEKLSNRLGFSAILVMGLFYAGFFMYLQRKSTQIATQIATPVEQLSRLTSSIGEDAPELAIPPVGISEIDLLSDNFTSMTKKLHLRTQELVEAQIRERTKEFEAEKFEKLAITDRLTGIYNRHKLDSVLQTELDRSKRHGRIFGVMMLDIDHFKKVNDTYGHQIGDELLKDLAQMLRTSIRGTDTVGRWGGEEFLIICPETNAEGLFRLAEKLRLAIERQDFPFVSNITVSLGITMNQPGDTAIEILARADRALYTAKREGRNRVEIFTPLLH